MARHTAFEILYRDYYVRIFGLCRRLLNNPELAEDAAQETFMRAYKQFNKFDTAQPFWHWIAAIANNHCIDLLRQSNKQAQLFGDESNEAEALNADPSTPLNQVIQGQDSEALREAIGTLSDKYRVPLVLAYFSHASYGEIAEQLDISTSHVGILLLRAKKQLRKQLSHPPSATIGRAPSERDQA